MTGPWVLHVDLDQFLAAVEVLRHPELAGLPIIVGGRGDPTERAVVSTASYEAREFGVRSGMPLKTAVRRCPDAILLPVDAPVYTAASDQVMSTLRGLDNPDAGPVATGPVVEVLGWDEAFIGIETDDPESFARHVQAEVLAATSLHCSVGIGDTKVRAKIATDFGKPHGIFTLTRDNWFEVMGTRPTDAIWGIGTRIKTRLAALGIDTVHDLALADEAASDRRVRVRRGATLQPPRTRGQQRSRRRHPRVARAHGRETTYQSNLIDPAEIAAAIRVLADQVVDDIRRENRPCARVHLKVRFAPFFTTTRIRKLPEPTFDAATIAATALELLEKLADDRPVRLLGVRAEMVEPEGG